jgi:hypothetical protein
MEHQKSGGNRRDYERFAVGFKVSIFDMREPGQQLLEESVLKDVSGGGVGFLSRSPGLYHPGQRLRISIILPGTDVLDARLEGNATVAWVDEERSDTKGVSVGISVDDLLDFGRTTRSATDDQGTGA